MTPRRRDVLTLLAGGTAGCSDLDLGTGGSDPGETATPIPAATRTGTPTDTATTEPPADVVQEDSRMDQPPHDPERPERSESGSHEERREAWDEAYLGEGMATDSTLEYDPIRFSFEDVLDPGHRYDEYRVRLAGSAEAARRVFDAPSDRIEWFDFDERLLVVVESGYGSGSVEHRWARAEPFERGVHLHGYYTDPLAQTDDLVTRVSKLGVERPDGPVEFVRVSLTVGVGARVNFNSTEGVVVPAEDLTADSIR